MYNHEIINILTYRLVCNLIILIMQKNPFAHITMNVLNKLVIEYVKA